MPCMRLYKWHISCKSVAAVSSIGRSSVAVLMLISCRSAPPAFHVLPQVICPYAPGVFFRVITTSSNSPEKKAGVQCAEHFF